MIDGIEVGDTVYASDSGSMWRAKAVGVFVSSKGEPFATVEDTDGLVSVYKTKYLEVLKPPKIEEWWVNLYGLQYGNFDLGFGHSDKELADKVCRERLGQIKMTLHDDTPVAIELVKE